MLQCKTRPLLSFHFKSFLVSFKRIDYYSWKIISNNEVWGHQCDEWYINWNVMSCLRSAFCFIPPRLRSTVTSYQLSKWQTSTQARQISAIGGMFLPLSLIDGTTTKTAVRYTYLYLYIIYTYFWHHLDTCSVHITTTSLFSSQRIKKTETEFLLWYSNLWSEQFYYCVIISY